MFFAFDFAVVSECNGFTFFLIRLFSAEEEMCTLLIFYEILFEVFEFQSDT